MNIQFTPLDLDQSSHQPHDVKKHFNYADHRLERRENMKKPLDLQEAWLLAIQKEQEARDVYAELSELVDDAALKSLFDFLVEQEEDHKRRLQEEYDRVFMSDF